MDPLPRLHLYVHARHAAIGQQLAQYFRTQGLEVNIRPLDRLPDPVVVAEILKHDLLSVLVHPDAERFHAIVTAVEAVPTHFFYPIACLWIAWLDEAPDALSPPLSVPVLRLEEEAGAIASASLQTVSSWFALGQDSSAWGSPLPSDESHDILAGKSLLAQHRFQDAVTLLQSALSQTPGSVSLTLLLAEAYRRLSETELALVLTQRLLEQHADIPLVWIVHGQILLVHHRLSDAQAVFTHISLTSSTLQGWIDIAGAFEETGFLEEAHACYQSALQHLSAPELWNGWGALLAHQGAFDRALDACLHAVRSHPSWYLGWTNLGKIYLEMQCPADALEAFDQGLTLIPDMSDIWYHKGAALRDLERWEEALMAYEQAITYQPRDAGAWVNHGVTLNRLGRVEEAIVSYQQALKLDPDQIFAQENLAYTYLDLNRGDEAQPLLEQLIAGDSADHQDWESLGYLYYRQQRYEEALQLLDHAIALASDDYQAWYDKGNCHLKLWQFQEMGEAWDRAEAIHPAGTEALFRADLERLLPPDSTVLLAVIESLRSEEGPAALPLSHLVCLAWGLALQTAGHKPMGQILIERALAVPEPERTLLRQFMLLVQEFLP